MNPTISYQDAASKLQGDPAALASLKTAYQTKGIPLDSTVPKDITSANLTPSQPVNIPGQPVPVAGADLNGTIAGNLDANQRLQQYQDQQIKDAQAAKNSAGTDYKTAIQSLIDLPQQEDKLNQQYDIAGKTAAKNEIDAKILGERNALNHTKDAIFSATGVSREQAGQQFGEAERQSLSKQADLSVMQFVAGNDLASAQNIIEKKIALQTESLKTTAQYYKDFYDQNEQILTDAQKAKAQSLITSADREYQQTVEDKKTINNIGLQYLQSGGNGLTAQKIMNANSIAEAASLTGNVIGAKSLLELQKLNLEIAKIKKESDGTISPKQQQALEQQYRQVLVKELSNRSGGLGLQDAKVNQAIHLRSLLDQYKDANGNYNVPAAQYGELAIGLANLLSSSNVASDSARQSIMQKTAVGDIKGALSYITGTPQNGSTQAVIKNLADSIDRQGQVAEDLRDQSVKFLHGLAPTDLSPERIQALETNNLASYRGFNQTGIGANVSTAQNQGYSSKDIVDHLLKDPTYATKIQQARDQKISDDDIVNYLKNQ